MGVVTFQRFDSLAACQGKYTLSSSPTVGVLCLERSFLCYHVWPPEERDSNEIIIMQISEYILEIGRVKFKIIKIDSIYSKNIKEMFWTKARVFVY